MYSLRWIVQLYSRRQKCISKNDTNSSDIKNLAYFPDYGIVVAMQINSDSSKIEEHFEAIVKIIMKTIDPDLIKRSG